MHQQDGNLAAVLLGFRRSNEHHSRFVIDSTRHRGLHSSEPTRLPLEGVPQLCRRPDPALRLELEKDSHLL
jgi:hypothetical protein